MSRRNVSQNIKRTIKSEIAGEIKIALELSAERGSAVTSRGDCIAFQIKTIGTMRFIHVGGFIGGIATSMPGSVERAAKESAAAAMLALGYTRS